MSTDTPPIATTSAGQDAERATNPERGQPESRGEEPGQERTSEGRLRQPPGRAHRPPARRAKAIAAPRTLLLDPTMIHSAGVAGFYLRPTRRVRASAYSGSGAGGTEAGDEQTGSAGSTERGDTPFSKESASGASRCGIPRENGARAHHLPPPTDSHNVRYLLHREQSMRPTDTTTTL